MSNAYIDPIARLLGGWSQGLCAASILFRLGAAFVLAAIIGWERANKRHSAGLRTFILVAIGATAAMLLDLSAAGPGGHGLLLSAASLVGIALISGNSFWYSSRNQVKGLTTAVALWACGFVGLALGGGCYTAAGAVFLALWVCLSLLPGLESWLKDRSNHFQIHLELKNRTRLQEFITTIRLLGLRIDDIESNPAYFNTGLSVFSISITITRQELKKYKTHREIVEALATLDYISHVEEIG